MSGDIHERARELIVLAGVDSSDDQRTWLRTHLDECEACRDYVEASVGVIGALRSHSLAADATLLEATRWRVRSRALELRKQQERLWLVCLSCALVALSAAITAPLSWRAFEWIGRQVGVSNSVWQTGFTLFWIAPSLVVSTVLLARGIHLTNNEEERWR